MEKQRSLVNHEVNRASSLRRIRAAGAGKVQDFCLVYSGVEAFAFAVLHNMTGSLANVTPVALSIWTNGERSHAHVVVACPEGDTPICGVDAVGIGSRVTSTEASRTAIGAFVRQIGLAARSFGALAVFHGFVEGDGPRGCRRGEEEQHDEACHEALEVEHIVG